jgi:hypothetical protein
MQCSRNSLTFQGNVLLPPSKVKSSKPNKETVRLLCSATSQKTVLFIVIAVET